MQDQVMTKTKRARQQMKLVLHNLLDKLLLLWTVRTQEPTVLKKTPTQEAGGILDVQSSIVKFEATPVQSNKNLPKTTVKSKNRNQHDTNHQRK